MVYLFLAEGFEETEAIATADIIARGGCEVKLVSVTGDIKVTGTHGFKFEADILFEYADFSDAEICILPGGMPGTNNLMAHEGLVELIKARNAEGKRIAAICAAPMVFGVNGLLEGKNAVCYPGCEGNLKGATVVNAKAVTDGNITTSMGPATAPYFGLEILSLLKDRETADKVAEDFLLK